MAWETRRRWSRVAELAATLPFLVIGLAGTWPAAHNQPDAGRLPDGWAFLLVTVAALALALHRRPAASLALNGSAVAAYLFAGYPYGPILLTVPATVLPIALRWPVRRVAAWVAGYLAAILTAALVKEWRAPGGGHGLELLWLPLAWLAVVTAVVAVGAAVRVRREAAAGVRAEQARRAASEERLRMAQELHDTVGHGLAVIAMQAGVALHVLDRDPGQARESLRAVQATSREALDSLRAELAALRSPDTAAARRPTAGLEDVGRLVERVRSGGVTVRVDVASDLPPLPPAVDAAAYRILQESLTNVLRHAGATRARILVHREDGVLLVDVTDSGPPAGAAWPAGGAGDGSGIRGMRAQAEALGGTLVAGAVPTGGFAVTARLPLTAGGRP